MKKYTTEDLFNDMAMFHAKRIKRLIDNEITKGVRKNV